MVVGWEVDRGERDVAEETGGGTFVEADETQVSNDPHRRAPGCAFDGFGDLALDLEADFDDFEGVGEDLIVDNKG